MMIFGPLIYFICAFFSVATWLRADDGGMNGGPRNFGWLQMRYKWYVCMYVLIHFTLQFKLDLTICHEVGRIFPYHRVSYVINYVRRQSRNGAPLQTSARKLVRKRTLPGMKRVML